MKKIFLLLFLLFVFPIYVGALSINPTIQCDKTNLINNEETNCKFIVNVSDGKISAISAKYSYESKYMDILVTPEGSWQGNADGNRVDYYDYNDYSGEVLVSNIKIKPKYGSINGKVSTALSFNVIEVGDENGRAYNFTDKETLVNFNLEKNNATTTKNITTTTTYKTIKNTTTKNVVITKNTNNSNVTTTTTVKSTQEETTSKIKVTTKKSQIKTTISSANKNSDSKIFIILFLLIFLILLLIGIIIVIKEERQKKNE